MLSYCLRCKQKNKKKTENINLRISKTSNGKIMLLWKSVIRGGKKSRFIKKLEEKLIIK